MEDYVNRLTKQAILKVLWADDHSYLRCKHDPMASLPVCVSTSLKPDIEKARLTASQNDTIKAEPMHIIYSGIFSIMVGLGVFFLVFLSRRGGARNQRRRTVRHLVDIHPKDRSAEVKRLADQLGLMSMYDEGETEKYSDAVADKEMSPGVGA